MEHKPHKIACPRCNGVAKICITEAIIECPECKSDPGKTTDWGYLIDDWERLKALEEKWEADQAMQKKGNQ